MIRISTALIAVALLSGCGAGPLAYLKEHPPKELGCPAEQWQTERVGESGLIYITGCGEIIRYTAHCNPNGLCMNEQHVLVSQGLRRQAAFDLKCDELITLSRIGTDTFGARGCGRQASYTLMKCGLTECTIVQNTQTQQ